MKTSRAIDPGVRITRPLDLAGLLRS